jgi:hypothetical protein
MILLDVMAAEYAVRALQAFPAGGADSAFKWDLQQ